MVPSTQGTLRLTFHTDYKQHRVISNIALLSQARNVLAHFPELRSRDLHFFFPLPDAPPLIVATLGALRAVECRGQQNIRKQ
jgi:hypothetical protein